MADKNKGFQQAGDGQAHQPQCCRNQRSQPGNEGDGGAQCMPAYQGKAPWKQQGDGAEK